MDNFDLNEYMDLAEAYAASQIPGKYLCFLVTRATEKRHVDPENLVLSLTDTRNLF